MSLRAIKTLREVDLIAAEDTRITRRLLSRYGIKTPLTSYHEHSKRRKLEYLLDTLMEKDVALVSDSGMPGLSDPGCELIGAAIERGIKVVAVPGPSALITALVISGLPTKSFVYLGFLPRRRKERQRMIASVARERRTIVAFESPHRLLESLADLREFLGDRRISVARELTKMHEEVWRGRIGEALSYFEENPPRGEFTLVIEGAEEETWDEGRVRGELVKMLEEGIAKRDAVKIVAEISGWPKREVYKLAMEEENDYSR
jgi:16S rRNA (cytidine1402-2'-O)-methyltransferase